MHRTDPTNRITSGPWAEIDLAALCENFAMLCAATPNAETAAVVKSSAYGLGLAPVAQALAERENCRTFFVAYPEEGAELREALAKIAPDATIYVFNGPLPESLGIFDETALTPVINSLEQVRDWTTHKAGAPCALHLDTGMNRLGAPLADLEKIAALPGLNVNLFMSHLACGSDPAHKKNVEQRQTFVETAKYFPTVQRSLSASAGAMMDASYHFDLTRPGIALYGGSPFDNDNARIKPVVTLKAPIVQLRTLEAGESVGYSATFVAKRPTKIAVAAIGYGDGVPVAGSGKIETAINGARAPIAGRVSMDLVCLDVTDLKDPPQIGEPVEFFGKSVSLFEAAQACGTIPYELLTGLGGRVDRRYV